MKRTPSFSSAKEVRFDWVARLCRAVTTWSGALFAIAACGSNAAPPPSSPQSGGSSTVPLQLVPPGVKDVLQFTEATCRDLYSQTSDYLLVEMDAADDDGTWKRLNNEEQWAEYSESNPRATAGITRQGDWALVSLSRTSIVGDWLEYVDLCFGPDGRLREAHGRFNTFSSTCAGGGISRESLQGFDADGQRRSLSVDVRHLSTLAPLQCAEGDVERPDYLTVDQLPFPLSE